jgi:hypothetical protein
MPLLTVLFQRPGECSTYANMSCGDLIVWRVIEASVARETCMQKNGWSSKDRVPAYSVLEV